MAWSGASRARPARRSRPRGRRRCLARRRAARTAPQPGASGRHAVSAPPTSRHTLRNGSAHARAGKRAHGHLRPHRTPLGCVASCRLARCDVACCDGGRKSVVADTVTADERRCVVVDERAARSQLAQADGREHLPRHESIVWSFIPCRRSGGMLRRLLSR